MNKLEELVARLEADAEKLRNIQPGVYYSGILEMRINEANLLTEAAKAIKRLKVFVEQVERDCRTTPDTLQRARNALTGEEQ